MGNTKNVFGIKRGKKFIYQLRDFKVILDYKIKIQFKAINVSFRIDQIISHNIPIHISNYFKLYPSISNQISSIISIFWYIGTLDVLLRKYTYDFYLPQIFHIDKMLYSLENNVMLRHENLRKDRD